MHLFDISARFKLTTKFSVAAHLIYDSFIFIKFTCLPGYVTLTKDKLGAVLEKKVDVSQDLSI